MVSGGNFDAVPVHFCWVSRKEVAKSTMHVTEFPGWSMLSTYSIIHNPKAKTANSLPVRLFGNSVLELGIWGPNLGFLIMVGVIVRAIMVWDVIIVAQRMQQHPKSFRFLLCACSNFQSR